MDRQKSDQYFTVYMALEAIKAAYPNCEISWHSLYFDYYAWPVTFSNTGGPFARAGGVYGQAMTKYTIEAWVDGKYAALFCSGKLIKVIDDFTDIYSVKLR